MEEFDEDSDDHRSCASLTSDSEDEADDEAIRDIADNDGHAAQNLHPNEAIAPLSAPPKGHKLLVHKYDSFEELMEELQAFAASAQFRVVKIRSINRVEGFGYTRYDLGCHKGKIRKSKAVSRNTSTSKIGCP